MVAARRLAAELGLDRSAPVTNLVFMGMGEPLANMGAVLRSLPILTHAQGLHFSHNKARPRPPRLSLFSVFKIQSCIGALSHEALHRIPILAA